ASRRSALVTCWNDKEGRGLIDLVGCKTLALDGPPVAVGSTLSDIVVELATRRWSDLDDLIVVGFGSELAGLDRVECLTDTRAAATHLVEVSQGDLRRPRSRCLVVAPPVGRGLALDSLASLIELVHSLPDTGLVCCDASLRGVRAVWRLAAHRQTIELEFQPAGRSPNAQRPLSLAPGRAARSTQTASSRAAEEPPGDPLGTPPESGAQGRTLECSGPSRAESTATTGQPLAEIDVRSDRDSPRSLGSPAVTGGILVRVLGPVDVIGTRVPLDRRPTITELVVYLAFHPNGCSGEALHNALWPERRVPSQTVANRLSEARHALGATLDGAPRLRRVSARHVLADDIVTDWSQFDELTCAGTVPSQWERALVLVRGRPFEGLQEGDWAVLEGFVPSIQIRIVDTASRLASHLLASGDPARAEWAARRGLMASPWDERLYRALMVIAHAAGNRGGVAAALKSLAHALSVKGNPLDGVHPETAALYRELTSLDASSGASPA
ncbi:MAG: AfsR/SARP family transcriptional regulator, partial [Acidimicrobiales bacterium]